MCSWNVPNWLPVPLGVQLSQHMIHRCKLIWNNNNLLVNQTTRRRNGLKIFGTAEPTAAAFYAQWQPCAKSLNSRAVDTAVWCRGMSEYCHRCDPRHWTRPCHVLAKWHFSGAQPLAVASGVLTHKFHAATFWLSLVLTGRVTINCQTRRFTEPQIIKYSVASVAKFRFQFKDHQSGHHAAKALVTSFFPAERSSGTVT